MKEISEIQFRRANVSYIEQRNKFLMQYLFHLPILTQQYLEQVVI